MEQRVADIHDGATPESVWLLEHPHLYTAGTSANDADLLRHDLPVFQTGRGGQYTYHGPGQRVGYVMLNLRQRQVTPDIKRFVWQLEEWIIRTLACLGVKGERREGRVGIWVDMAPYGFAAGYEAKIAAIGVRIRRWVSFHGIAINVDPDLSMFNGIVPCGISQHGVTSLKQLGFDVEMSAFDDILKQEFLGVFGNDNTASHERLGAERV
jgi:lipoyl(octanoyl) transferase